MLARAISHGIRRALKANATLSQMRAYIEDSHAEPKNRDDNPVVDHPSQEYPRKSQAGAGPVEES